MKLEAHPVGLDFDTVKDHLGVSKHFQNNVLALFIQTGDVVTRAQRERDRRWHQCKLTPAMEMDLLNQVLDNPHATLEGHATKIYLKHGVAVHVSIICRAIHRNNLSFKSVSRASLHFLALRA